MQSGGKKIAQDNNIEMKRGSIIPLALIQHPVCSFPA